MINNASLALDGYSFQCIINGHLSEVGYLRVLKIFTTTLATTINDVSSELFTRGKRLYSYNVN